MKKYFNLNTLSEFNACLSAPFKDNVFSDNTSGTISDGSIAFNTNYNALRIKDASNSTKGTVNIKLGWLNVGDVVEVELEFMNISGTKGKIAIDQYDNSDYTWNANFKGNVTVQSQLFGEFEKIGCKLICTTSGYGMVVAGTYTSDIGDFYVRNVEVKVTTKTSKQPTNNVKVNGTTYTPNEDGLIDLGSISGGGGTGAITSTIADTTYYVSPTGSDSNDGLTAGSPFLTLQKAIDTIPKLLNHTGTIQLAAGTYDGFHIVRGFIGERLYIKGGTDITSAANYIIKGMVYVVGNSTRVYLNGVTVSPSSLTPSVHMALVKAEGTQQLVMNTCKVDGTKGSYAGNTLYGVMYRQANGYMYGCDVSNVTASGYPTEGVGIYCTISGTLTSENGSGSNNSVGLKATLGGTIVKVGTQTTGTTPESVTTGGLIRT